MTRPQSTAGKARVTTLTLNPAIDISSETDKIRPTHKIRTTGERMEPGGGGINVAKTLQAFGVDTHAIYLGGGGTGRALAHMLDEMQLESTCVPIAGQTRMSLAVYERSSGQEFRFVPEGPEVREGEWTQCLTAASAFACDYFVASGSLPRGVPDDFYARLGTKLQDAKIHYVLDTSGPELKAAVKAGGIFLLKPSRGEFEQLVGRSLSGADLAEAAGKLVRDGAAKWVAITLGRDGAVLVGRNESYTLPGVPVKAVSAVGAGDSFLGVMTYAFAIGMEAKEAFRLAVAAGAAAAEAMGTELCKPSEVERLVKLVPEL